MTITPTIHNWPVSVVPQNQVFYAPGQGISGAYTVGGANALSPEPGGVAFLEMDFNYADTTSNGRIISWLMSQIANGSVFRIPIVKSVQVLQASDIGVTVPDSYETVGVPWEQDGSDLLWDQDIGWAYELNVKSTAHYLAGVTSITLDMANYNQKLLPGHVIGHQGRAYAVMSISYDDSDVATLTISPPLRAEMKPNDDVTLSPTMIGKVKDPASFRSKYEYGQYIKPGPITFIEALV